jgi:hypothetical protein
MAFAHDRFEQSLDVLDRLTPDLQALDERYRADGVVWRRGLPDAEAAAQQIAAQLAQFSDETATSTREGASSRLHTRIVADERNGDMTMPAQQTARPPKRRINSTITWLAPVAAVLLIAVLAALIFANRHVGTSVVGTPTQSITTLPAIHLENGSLITLLGVGMVSAKEGWAIASVTINPTSSSDGNRVNLILHDHNGTWWSIAPVHTIHDSYGTWNPTNPETKLLAISADSPTDVWIAARAVGNNGAVSTYVIHYDGKQWTRQLVAINFESLKMFSPTNGWAIGPHEGLTPGFAYGQIYHYNGQTWKALPDPNIPNCFLNEPVNFSPIPAFNPRFEPLADGEVWAVGTCSPSANNQTGIILHYTGQQWSVQPFPSSGTNPTLYAISMISPQEGWIIGSDTSGNFLLHYSQGQWQRAPSTQLTNVLQQANLDFADILSFSMLSANEGLLLLRTYAEPSGSVVLHDQGGHWAPVTLPPFDFLSKLNNPNEPLSGVITYGWILYSITTLPPGDVWVYGVVVKSIIPKGQHQAITVQLPLLLHYSSGTWSVVQIDLS